MLDIGTIPERVLRVADTPAEPKESCKSEHHAGTDPSAQVVSGYGTGQSPPED